MRRIIAAALMSVCLAGCQPGETEVGSTRQAEPAKSNGPKSVWGENIDQAKNIRGKLEQRDNNTAKKADVF